ncbi:O161 family O-antigen flippase [Escherichia coli]|uniref:Putative O-antigen transporter n=3 Tax=Escherichia coli TaxID=562 RepID=D8WNA4_ECOLX|nr:O161 family O-antigen flippase [Escherichia coli]EGO9527306.1 O161 family O-antigen flippase [Escherichia coli O24]ADJ19201.1 Wzx [Escherichia coli]EAC1391334.1 O161 family O-antigen flippase [Escherichia coli]EEW2073830.1 O161 family O-antigen flippase [Escherichia coli]EFL7098393.1 O161 family O-antigen flippase [Escherichia coli]
MKIKGLFYNLSKPLGYLVGDIVNKAIPFLLLPVIVSKISIETYGYYSVEVVIYSFFCCLLTMGAQAKIILDISRDEIHSNVVTSNVLVLFFLLSVFCGCLLFILNIFDGLINPNINITLVFFCAIIQSFVNICLTRYQAENRVKIFVAINIIYTLAYFFGVLYSLFIDHWDNVWKNIILFYVLTTITMFFFYFIRKGKVVKLFFFHYISKNKVYETFIFGLYQLPHVLSSWVRLGYDRLVLGELISMSYVGGYSVAVQISLVSSVIFQSLNRFWTPFFIKKLKENSKQKKIIVLGGFGIICITILNILFGYAYFIFFLPTNYSSFSNALPILCMAYMFQGLYFLIVNYIYYHDGNKLISIPSVASIAIHIAVAPVLIKHMGYYGAAISLLISWIVLFLFTCVIIFYVRRGYRG